MGLKKDMNDIEFSVTTTSGQVIIVKSGYFYGQVILKLLLVMSMEQLQNRIY